MSVSCGGSRPSPGGRRRARRREAARLADAGCSTSGRPDAGARRSRTTRRHDADVAATSSGSASATGRRRPRRSSAIPRSSDYALVRRGRTPATRARRSDRGRHGDRGRRLRRRRQLHPGAARGHDRARWRAGSAARRHGRRQRRRRACSTRDRAAADPRQARGRVRRDVRRPPGPVLLDAELTRSRPRASPTPATGRGAGAPTSYGVQTVCVFLEEEGDDRQFANDTVNPPMVDVSPPCTATPPPLRRGAQVARSRAKRQLRHAKRRAGRARLKKLVAKRSRTVARERGRRGSAVQPGLLLGGSGARCVGGSHGRRLARAAPGPRSAPPSAPALADAPPIRHVFMIVLENESASTTFGAGSPAPYLSDHAARRGRLSAQLLRDRAREQRQLHRDDQRPGAERAEPGRLPVLRQLQPADDRRLGQAEGTGCVYPADVPTIAEPADGGRAHLARLQRGMGADPTREASECGHPGSARSTTPQNATADRPVRDAPRPVRLLPLDHRRHERCATPTSSTSTCCRTTSPPRPTHPTTFHHAGPCDDGHDATVRERRPRRPRAGRRVPAPVGPADHRLAGVPQQNGLLIVTFDEAEYDDASSCCGEIPGPGSPLPGIFGPGGGDVGAVLLSPCIAPARSPTAYNHYSMLRSVEDIFGLPHLGYARLPGALVRLGRVHALLRREHPRAAAKRDREDPPQAALRRSAAGGLAPASG